MADTWQMTHGNAIVNEIIFSERQQGIIRKQSTDACIRRQWPLLLTWFNFYSSMDK